MVSNGNNNFSDLIDGDLTTCFTVDQTSSCHSALKVNVNVTQALMGTFYTLELNHSYVLYLKSVTLPAKAYMGKSKINLAKLLAILINCPRRTEGRGFEPQAKPPSMLADTSASIVGRCCTRGESEDHTCKKACKKGSTLVLKPRENITRIPKKGYQ